MIAASEIIPNLATIGGFPKSTVRQHYRKQHEAGMMPRSVGSTIAKLSPRHVALLLLSLAVDAPAKDAAAIARAYYSLVDENGNQIGDVLAAFLNSFRSANDIAKLAYRSRVDVDCDSPRACIVSDTTDGVIETIYGVRDKPWSDLRVRRVTSIGGKVLFDLGMGMHFGRWAETNSDKTTKEAV